MSNRHEQTTVPSLADEFGAAELGDRRRTQRLCAIAEAAGRAPARGFPQQAGSSAELEGTYRLLNNPHVSFDEVLGVHVERAVERIGEDREVLVLHDTTEFAFGGEATRVGLGRLRGDNGKPGFFAHVAFAVSPAGRPLGVVGIEAWTRTHAPHGKRSVNELKADEGRESLRWSRLAIQVGERLRGPTVPIHVMDREGDDYETLSALSEAGHDFVIRVMHDRKLGGEEVGGEQQRSASTKLYAALEDASVEAEREVRLSRRTGKGKTKRHKQIHPSRDTRTARLAIHATTLTIACPTHRQQELPGSVTLNYVYVYEPHPPEGQAPVCWRLMTTLPIDTADQVLQIVDVYRLRWTIEEFFKALKTGCRYESRQLESLDALLIALAVFSAVAWRMLLLRWVARHTPDKPADDVLTPVQLLALKANAVRKRRKLPSEPTARQALMEVAALGGHIKNNGEPGWMVLGRGFETLLKLEVAWLDALEFAAGPDAINH